MSEAVVIIRPSFKKICGDDDACRAAIFNQLLYSIAWKIKQGCQYWFATAEDICSAIDNSWSVNKVRKEVAALVEAGLLGQQHNAEKGWDRTFQYFFGEKQAQKLKALCKKIGVCLLNIGLPVDVLTFLKRVKAIDEKCDCAFCKAQKEEKHLPNLVNGTTKNGKCIYQKEEMQTPNMADAFTKFGGAIPEEPTEDITEKPTEEPAKDGGTSRERTTEPLPVLEPPSLPTPSNDVSFDFSSLTENTPHSWQAIASIGEHYLGKGKATRQAAEALIQKTQSLASLIGPQEVRRLVVTVVTYMAFSDDQKNWFKGDKRKQLTLNSVATFWDDYSRKVEEAGWIPPADKVPSWYQEDVPVAASTETYIGMTKGEADYIAGLIEQEYPGMKYSFGQLPGNRCTVGLWLGEEDAWADLYSLSDWQQRETFQPQWGWVIETWEPMREMERIAA